MTLPVRWRAALLALPWMPLGASWGGDGARPVDDADQAPREVACVRASGPIRVDGVADEDAWAHAPWTEPFVDIRGDDAPAPGLATRARLLWDDVYLYVHADMEAPHLWATLRERDDTIWHDDDFEVFLDPDGDGRDYFEVEVNALGAVLDLFLDKPYAQRGKADLAWGLPGLQVGVHLLGTLNDPSDLDGGWSVEMAIPWAELIRPGADAPGRPPAVGDVWRVNFSRVVWPMESRDGAYAKATGGRRRGAIPRATGSGRPRASSTCTGRSGGAGFASPARRRVGHEAAGLPAQCPGRRGWGGGRSRDGTAGRRIVAVARAGRKIPR